MHSYRVLFTGGGIVVPLLPLYAHDLGASGLYVGLIFGAFCLSQTFFPALFRSTLGFKGPQAHHSPRFFAYVLISVAFIYSDAVNTLIIMRFFMDNLTV